MPNRPSTDNFLHNSGSKGRYISRPTEYIHRRDYTHEINATRQKPISDFLAPHPQKTLWVAPEPLANPTIQDIPVINPAATAQFSPVIKLEALAHTRRVPKKPLLYILLLSILAPGIITLCNLNLGHSQAERPKVSHADSHAKITTQAAVLPKPKQLSFGYPVRLKIPKINVDASLDYVALNTQGELSTPKVAANAGWYDRGPRPGMPGNAVIDGHFGWKGNVPAVFDDLHALAKGDVINVQDEKGVVIAFVVRETRLYDPHQDSSEIFLAADTQAHLNLITCDGTWNEAQKSYSNRLVVFADKQ